MSLASKSNLRLEKAATTRLSLIVAARRMFAEKGYHNAGTPDLVAAAGVSRGALYHHFRDKEALFEAVFRDVSAELAARASEAVMDFADDPWRHMQAGLRAYLRIIASSRDVQQIMLLDGPAVLGWARWREIESEYTHGLLVLSLEKAMPDAATRPKIGPLAHLILAALNDAALMIAHSETPERAFAEASEALQMLTSGVKSPN